MLCLSYQPLCLSPLYVLLLNVRRLVVMVMSTSQRCFFWHLSCSAVHKDKSRNPPYVLKRSPSTTYLCLMSQAFVRWRVSGRVTVKLASCCRSTQCVSHREHFAIDSQSCQSGEAVSLFCMNIYAYSFCVRYRDYVLIDDVSPTVFNFIKPYRYNCTCPATVRVVQSI